MYTLTKCYWFDSWKLCVHAESVSDEDEQVGMQVLELCIEREIFDIINYYISYSKLLFIYIFYLDYFNVLTISMDVYFEYRYK